MNEATGTLAMCDVRLLAKGTHTDVVNAGSRGLLRDLANNTEAGQRPRCPCGGGQHQWGRGTGVGSGRDLAGPWGEQRRWRTWSPGRRCNWSTGRRSMREQRRGRGAGLR